MRLHIAKLLLGVVVKTGTNVQSDLRDATHRRTLPELDMMRRYCLSKLGSRFLVPFLPAKYWAYPQLFGRYTLEGVLLPIIGITERATGFILGHCIRREQTKVAGTMFVPIGSLGTRLAGSCLSRDATRP